MKLRRKFAGLIIALTVIFTSIIGYNRVIAGYYDVQQVFCAFPMVCTTVGFGTTVSIDSTVLSQFSNRVQNVLWVDQNAPFAGNGLFLSIPAAINYINTLPLAQRASRTNPYKIFISPGTYTIHDQIWLPDYVSFEGMGEDSTVLIGDNVFDFTAVPFLSGGVGSIKNLSLIVVDPPGFMADAPATMLYVRDIGQTVYSAHEDAFGVIAAGSTLIAEAGTTGAETFIFAGTETTAADVVATINATAVNLTARAKYGRVEIEANVAYMTVYSTGTANAALGFRTDQDTVSLYEGPGDDLHGYEYNTYENIFMCCTLGTVGSSGIDYDNGIINQKYFKGITAVFNRTGVLVERGRLVMSDSWIHDNFNGVDVAASAQATLVSTDVMWQDGTDIIMAATGNVGLYAGSAYQTRTDNGTITMKGMPFVAVFRKQGVFASGMLDTPLPLPFAAVVISDITVYRGIAGAGGTTTVQLFYGLSGEDQIHALYAAGDRPVIAAADGNYKIIGKQLPATGIAKLPALLSVGSPLAIKVNLDTVEAGAPEDITVTITYFEAALDYPPWPP